jgi:Reverse transcriptase (RNA-dependent DNA polymerase)/RNase H-like domain found in reverse transcriptase
MNDESVEDMEAMDRLNPNLDAPDLEIRNIRLDSDYWKEEIPDALERAAAKAEVRAAFATLNDHNGQLFGTQAGLLRNLPPDIGEFKIPLKPGTTPQRMPMRRFKPTEVEEIKRQLTSMLEKGIVQVASSPWNSGVILAKKPDGSWRLTIDMRLLNTVTAESGYKTFPLRRTDDILRECRGVELFTLLDGRASYWQVPMAEGDIPQTAFTVPGIGTLVWRRMPMGHTSSPAAFQMIAEYLCSEASENPSMFPVCATTAVRKYLAYLDDFTVGTTRGGWQEHLKALMAFLLKLKFHGFTLRADKCRFFQTKVKLLGHMVDGKGVYPCEEYTNKVAQFRDFRTVKQLQSFLGLAGYYRQYVKGFAQMTTPLRELLEASKGDKLIVWNSACEGGRLKLVAALQQGSPNGPLMHADFSRPFRIASDGCCDPGGVGAILEQEDLDDPGKFRPVAYTSKALTKQQMHWDVSRIEAFASSMR